MLFQKNIVKKYIATLNDDVEAAWNQYKSYFLNAAIQANIRQSKEEQFQEGFLRELFVKVLGYTLNPSPNFNLITEQKNETNSQKADGAILLDGNVIGVIELKDHKTTDLSKIEKQAFGYKSQHRDARYVIISNFEKLRLYIDNAVDFREWSLFTMTFDEFREMYLCIAWNQMKNGIALKIKSESVSSEDQITNALYKDYSQFKRLLFADILKNNPAPEDKNESDWQLLLFKKTQKLLDRLLFIFFAEDCGLLPPNSMVEIIKQWRQLKELDEYKPLYDRIKKYFGYLDTGHQGKHYEIFAYNGGLFKLDEVLDNLKISDEVLEEPTIKLASYDFESDVDVNILGHIFENSLSEIEEITQQITNGEIPRTSKRKQDGVFYTPQYITKYIVENTVGKLCAEKKADLGIVEEDYFSDQKRQKQTKIKLIEQLSQYREWLLQITICDPACGSGAFLNAALQFLIAEHKLIDEMEAKVAGESLVFPNVENSILENNLFGVDINEESVEIAQLALWLRTAKPHRKLNTLSQNIKCGNSLISDPAVAGDKAFDWQKEFPKVFEKGGFDVVIGNPPYVSAPTQMSNTEMAAQRQAIIDSGKYQFLYQKWDLYIPFIELGIRHLCKTGGFCSMIVPYPLTNQLYGQKCRQQFIDEYNLKGIVDCSGTKVFADAVVQSCIFITKKETPGNKVDISKINNAEIQFAFTKSYTDLIQDEKNYVWNLTQQKRKTNRYANMNVLGDYCYVSYGLRPNSDEKTAKGEFVKDDLISDIEDNIPRRKYIEAKDIERYKINRIRFLEYGTDRSPAKLVRPTFNEWFEPIKLFFNRLGDLVGTIDYNNKFLHNDSIIGAALWKDLRGIENNSISGSIKKFSKMTREEMESLSETIDLRYILTIMNSKYASVLLSDLRGGDYHIYPEHIRNIPIPSITLESQRPYIDLADKMLSLNSDMQKKRSRFLRRLQDNFEGVKITGALESFDTMEFVEFLKELKKQKITLSLSQQDEWEEYFNQYKTDCNNLSAEIAATDNEIDLRVYKLYGLTDDEIKIVEGTR